MLGMGSTTSGKRPEDIRYNNSRAVLGLFCHSDKLTVHEITDRFDLSKTATMNIINSLLSTGIIYYYGKGEPAGTSGKKPSLYALNPSYKHSITVGIGGEYIVAELLDFGLNKKNYYLHKPYDISYKAFIEGAAVAINRLLDQKRLTGNDLYGIVLYTGGIVDANSGVLLRPITRANWKNDLPVVRDLKKALPFNVPVYMDNICRFGGYFELLVHPENRNLTILSLYIDDFGVGGSLIQNGVIARGRHGLIGEFGHITTNYTLAEKCKCGRYGCFETVVTGNRVVERARKALTTVKDTAITPDSLKRIGDLFEGADKGDPFAQSQLDFVVEQFANMLYNMQIMYDPDMVIIQGIYANSGTYIKKKLNEAVTELSLYSIAKGLRLVFDDHDFREAVTIGASYYCREKFIMLM